MTISMIIGGCFSEPTFEERDYNYFCLIDAPEQETVYPEETLTFTFSDTLAADAGDFVSAECETDEECGITVSVTDKTLLISTLPEKDTVTLTLDTGIKSSDDRPLVKEEKDGYTSSEMIFTFIVGPALPDIEHTVPEDAVTHALLTTFDVPVKLSKENITPAPDALYITDKRLLLSFSDPVNQVTFTDIATPLRPGSADELSVHLSKPLPDKVKPEITTETTDTSCTVQIKSQTLVAVVAGDEVTPCDNDRCSVTKTDLSPEETVSFSFDLFSTGGRLSRTVECTTEPLRPHIMISEIMHTPAREPEKSWEFVELYNNGELDFDLVGCTIDDRNDGDGEDPLEYSGETAVLSPGEVALAVAIESFIPDESSGEPIILTVDDTTIADGGLTSTESIQIFCPGEDGRVIAASYDASYGQTERGRSLVFDENGTICESTDDGGSPGIYTECSD